MLITVYIDFIMGEMADLTLEWNDESDDDGHTFDTRVVKCKACKKEHLIWRKVHHTWILLECDRSIHTCDGYSPPIKIMKLIVEETIAQKREQDKQKLLDDCKERGSISKLIRVISENDLMDLYSSFLNMSFTSVDSEECTYGKCIRRNEYEYQVKIIREEIIRRITVKKL